MGYAHHVDRNRAFSKNEWEAIQKAFMKLIDHMPPRTDTAGGYHAEDPLIIDDGDGNPPKVDGDEIRFDGANGDSRMDLSCEPFRMTREGQNDPASVKTDRKPYDLMVCAVLLVTEKVAPDAVDVTSDGDRNGLEWQAARDFVGRVLTDDDLTPKPEGESMESWLQRKQAEYASVAF